MIYSKYMRKFLQQTDQNNRRNWKTKCVHVHNCKDLNNFFITSKKCYFKNRKTTVGSCVFCAPLHRYIGRHIDRLSIDVSVDISVEYQSICRPIYRSRVSRYVDRDVSVDISTDVYRPSDGRHIDRDICR